MLPAGNVNIGGHNRSYPSHEPSYAGGSERQKLCSVPLPDRRPFAPCDAPIAERLFIVANPDTFDNDILEDVFCRFGNLIGAYFMPGLHL